MMLAFEYPIKVNRIITAHCDQHVIFEQAAVLRLLTSSHRPTYFHFHTFAMPQGWTIRASVRCGL